MSGASLPLETEPGHFAGARMWRNWQTHWI